MSDILSLPPSCRSHSSRTSDDSKETNLGKGVIKYASWQPWANQKKKPKKKVRRAHAPVKEPVLPYPECAPPPEGLVPGGVPPHHHDGPPSVADVVAGHGHGLEGDEGGVLAPLAPPEPLHHPEDVPLHLQDALVAPPGVQGPVVPRPGLRLNLQGGGGRGASSVAN